MRQIGTLGTIDTLSVGGRVFTLSDLIILETIAKTAGRYGTFRKLNTSAGYSPGLGKSFRVMAVRIINIDSSSVSINSQSVLYADNDSGLATATAPVNPVYALALEVFAITADGASYVDYVTDFTIPTGKFADYDSSGATASLRIQLFGYEV